MGCAGTALKAKGKPLFIPFAFHLRKSFHAIKHGKNFHSRPLSSKPLTF